jgi:predicted CXXCH cytochrome family protein
VPFATNSANYTALAALARSGSPASAGPVRGDQVTCLSCHRAHASAFPRMLRWQMEYEFITFGGNYVGTDNAAMTSSWKPSQARGRTIAENQAGYYDRPATQFANNQRVLCNKCHTWD